MDTPDDFIETLLYPEFAWMSVAKGEAEQVKYLYPYEQMEQADA